MKVVFDKEFLVKVENVIDAIYPRVVENIKEDFRNTEILESKVSKIFNLINNKISNDDDYDKLRTKIFVDIEKKLYHDLNVKVRFSRTKIDEYVFAPCSLSQSIKRRKKHIFIFLIIFILGVILLCK